jgi:Zn-dependent M28 family amino/carboxypeptidase
MFFANRGILPVALSATLSVTLLSAAPVLAQRDSREARQIAGQYITQAQLRDYLTFIAADELEGRDTPSRGLNTAAKFIAMLMARWGVKPMGDNGTYFQKMTLERQSIEADKCSASLGDTALKISDDFIPNQNSGSGSAMGNLVYVGGGYVIKSKNVDAYKGIDVRGKILLVAARRLPEGVGPRDLQNSTRGTDWWDARAYAKANGAAGIIYLPVGMDERFWRMMGGQLTRPGRGFAPSMEKTDAAAEVPAITVSVAVAKKLFEGEKLDGDAILATSSSAALRESFALTDGKRLSFTVTSKRETQVTQNVVAVVEGSDPKLKNEYVAVGAHYDHVGIGTPNQSGDSIYNGADDDGSGTVGLIAMAEALANSKVKPKRSIVFVWHCGEEKGLWGSDFFTENPPVPLTQFVAQVNIDMIGRSKPEGDTERRNAELSGPNGIYVIGSRRMSTELGDLVERVNKNFLGLNYDYRYDRPDDPNNFFFRSDHYNYARKGVPVVFFFDGVHVDYHRPSDEVDKIDFVKYEKITRTVFATTVEIANLPKRLTVDKPLTPGRD